MAYPNEPLFVSLNAKVIRVHTSFVIPISHSFLGFFVNANDSVMCYSTVGGEGDVGLARYELGLLPHAQA